MTSSIKHFSSSLKLQPTLRNVKIQTLPDLSSLPLQCVAHHQCHRRRFRHPLRQAPPTILSSALILSMDHQVVNTQTNESRIAGNVEFVNSTIEPELLSTLPPSLEGGNDVNEGDKQTLTLQQVKTEDVKGTGSTLSGVHFDVEACRKALARMIIVDELPFKFLEGKEFRYFVSVVQPRFPIPSRISAAKDCLDIFIKEKHKLRSMFRRGLQCVRNSA